MKIRFKHIFLLGVILAAVVGVASIAEEYFEHKNKYGHDDNKKHYYENKSGENQFTTSALYQEYSSCCGTCHWAYIPQLLPSQSWKIILNSPKDHFGNELNISDKDMQVISRFLMNNAADTYSTKIGSKIMKSLGGTVPLRITDIPIFQKKHRKVDVSVFKRKSIQSPSNCIACHPSASQAQFDDDHVVIPGQ